ncbi:MAG: ATP-dependent metallopeptidase FtsH/Yme1/Tma family protein, partial [Deltaproteobacteria bacterium]|nr:ATP-dependent metallopeptidase FtsH/Yme1/Tma family protein [Deltaproteobacteria bacterium]
MADERKYPGNGQRGSTWKIAIALILFGAFIYIWGESADTGAGARQKITYTEFRNQLEAGNISTVTIEGEEVSGDFISPVTHSPARGQEPVRTMTFLTYLPSFQGPGIMSEFETRGVTVDVRPSGGSGFWQVFLLVLPWVLIIGIWVLIMRRVQQGGQGGAQGGLFNFGLSKAKLFNAKKPGVTFNGVAGLENAKTELQ